MQKKNLLNTFPVACHTDAIEPGGTFVAIKGMQKDGVDFIPQALEKGACTIVVGTNAVLPANVEKLIASHGAALVRVSEPRRALAELSAKASGNPASRLKFIAITGTKGKSTTTFLVEHLLRTAGLKTALLSTVKNKICGVDYPTTLTTQLPDYLHAFFAQCVEKGVEWVVMEVAAQAFSLHRVYGLFFEAGIYTNFSREHGEFYATQEDYFAAKKQLLSQLKPMAPLLLNRDDKNVAALGALYEPVFYFDSNHSYICPQLVGRFNAYNIAAAAALVRALGLPSLNEEILQQGFLTFPGVPGRLDRYMLPNGAVAFIDYAHNPASYTAVLTELRSMTDNLIVMFGAGGDRDPARRPLMGDIAASLADRVVLTSDNPRSEDPAVITNQILTGVKSVDRHKVVVELDREKAIHRAYAHSRPGSIIALLGKGPDEYQLVKGVKTRFSEREILMSLRSL
ncbi:TPA: hypothetical protein DDZ86_00160 [Candidatus Dependentiae bacterium]|nr:MAG: UDP-N-acetylmuramoyl-L-alanyl-D-glutamate-2,6-diaminopimelate ligase [candidate division TM6 bacterium GW2011_GWF2_43_87]HBL98041.1 hypothetical protein [Candidatus Dependentiae bacterium]